MEDPKQKTTSGNKEHPYSNANIFSKLFFIWLVPLFYKGYHKDLTEDDLYPSLKQHDASYLGDKLEKEWKTQLAKSKDPSLWRALFKMFRGELFVLGLVCMFVELFARLAQPIILSQLLAYYEPDTTMTKSEAYLWSSLLVSSPALVMICQHNYMYRQFTMGVKIKVAATALVYRKALKLSRSSLTETNVGQMVNLISNDVSKFENAVKQIHSLWLVPIELLVIVVLIYFSVGLTGMTGILFLISFIPFQMWLGKKTSVYRLHTAMRTDERIRLMNEIISGIQVIKMYTWEKPFAKLVEISRSKEMKQIRKTSIIRAAVYSFHVFVNKTAIYICIICYILTGNTLNAQFVYVVTSYYAVLRMMVTKRFPEGVTRMAEALISARRIKEFLLREEIETDHTNNFLNILPLQSSVYKQIPCHNSGTSGNAINLKDVYVKWNQKLEDWTLHDVTLEIPSQCLAVVIGPVGSGKTTLLHTVLKELPALQGSVNINGTISYASQESWLFMGSIRQNIIFGQPFDMERYKQVIKVCALERDLTLFPYGDKTTVGDRGVSLSGGQKARINLARAIYKMADIYLLDDPLSAVDTHVGKQIFDECIRYFLKDKCVVLVTHQLQYLRNADIIFLMDSGKAIFSGSYEEIEKCNHDYAKLLVELNQSEEQGDSAIENIDEDIQKNVANTVEKEKEGPKENKESKAVGNVALSVYKTYFKFGGHWCKGLWIILLFVFAQALATLTDYYISWWVNMEALRKIPNNATETTSSNNSNNNSGGLMAVLQNLWTTYLTEDLNLIIYTCLVIILIVLTLSRSVYFFRFALKVSTNLHNNMFDKIVYGTMRFFNSNPRGRILNRFSNDMNQVDELLPSTLLDSMQTMLTALATAVIIIVVNPWMVIPTVLVMTAFYAWRVVYISTSRDVKRVENITRSPVYSHLAASLHGLTTIRAFGAQEVLSKEFDRHQNRNSSPLITFLAIGRAFGMGLDFGCVIYIFFVTMSFLFFKTDTPGGFVGLSITQSLTLIGMLQMGIRQISELENQMTCVERIKEYIDIIPETDKGQNIPPKNWPSQGKIAFKGLTMRYGPEESPILKRLTFTINAKEKIGIVGRTGAGKSSIIIALFRLALNEGLIAIDDIDIETISLEHLRSVISIIPQEPVLFSGTLRKNLDPFDEYSDEIIWNALEDVELKEAVSDLPHGLTSQMSEGGSNFSVGQRQLVCLARSIIRKNRILVMDEATANVDPQTDALIQSTIREKFADCTVLTIAHRLHTIMDSDKVLVMDAGTVQQFGTPRELLQDKTGLFFGMVEQTGTAMAENLTLIAEKTYQELRGV